MLCAAVPLSAQERYALAGREVAVYNLAGRVRLEAGGGGEVVVEVERGGRDAEKLRVSSGMLEGRQALRVIYPGSRVVYGELGRGSRSTVRVHDDGTFGGRSGGRRVEVAGSGSGTEAHADMVVRVPEGMKLGIHLVAGRVDVANVKGDLRVDTHTAPVAASGTRGALTVDVGSGAVRISDAEGRVSIDTGSGSVAVNGIRGEKLLIDTGSGGVSGTGLDVGTLDVDVGSGIVRLSDVRMQEGKIDTGSGAVELDLRSDVRSLVIDTGSGSVRLGVPSALNAELVVDTGSGGVDVEGTVSVLQRSRSSFRGRFGEGRGRIRVDTGSGGVRVRQQ